MIGGCSRWMCNTAEVMIIHRCFCHGHPIRDNYQVSANTILISFCLKIAVGFKCQGTLFANKEIFHGFSDQYKTCNVVLPRPDYWLFQTRCVHKTYQYEYRKARFHLIKEFTTGGTKRQWFNCLTPPSRGGELECHLLSDLCRLPYWLSSSL